MIRSGALVPAPEGGRHPATPFRNIAGEPVLTIARPTPCDAFTLDTDNLDSGALV